MSPTPPSALTEPNTPGVDWKAAARRWENRAKARQVELDETRAQLARARAQLAGMRAQARTYRNAHDLLLESLAGRLDELADRIETDDQPTERTPTP